MDRVETRDYSQFNELLIDGGLPITFVSISDSYNNNVLEYLKKLGINTLADLFVAYDDGLFNDRRKRFSTDIKGQTELLMAYYMKTPLVADDILNKRISMNSKDNINEWYQTLAGPLSRVGITGLELHTLCNYCLAKFEKMPVYEDGTNSFINIIEMFTDDLKYQTGTVAADAYAKYVLDVIQNLKFKCALYKKYLEHEEWIQNGGRGFPNVNNAVTSTAIQELQKQMKFLLRARDNLDNQISLLQRQLSNIKDTGGMKK